MIQVKVMKDGKVVGGAAFKDSEQDTIRKSLVSTRNEMLKQGIEFDDLRAEFLGVNINFERLESAYLTPDDPELVKLRAIHEARARSIYE